MWTATRTSFVPQAWKEIKNTLDYITGCVISFKKNFTKAKQRKNKVFKNFLSFKLLKLLRQNKTKQTTKNKTIYSSAFSFLYFKTEQGKKNRIFSQYSFLKNFPILLLQCFANLSKPLWMYLLSSLVRKQMVTNYKLS